MILIGYGLNFKFMKRELFETNVVCFSRKTSELRGFEVWCINWTRDKTFQISFLVQRSFKDSFQIGFLCGLSWTLSLWNRGMLFESVLNKLYKFVKIIGWVGDAVVCSRFFKLCLIYLKGLFRSYFCISSFEI